jgi:hypothetical protein
MIRVSPRAPVAWRACSKGSRVVQNIRVAVDVGGTFTDICIMDEATGLIRIEDVVDARSHRRNYERRFQGRD